MGMGMDNLEKIIRLEERVKILEANVRKIDEDFKQEFKDIDQKLDKIIQFQDNQTGAWKALTVAGAFIAGAYFLVSAFVKDIFNFGG